MVPVAAAKTRATTRVRARAKARPTPVQIPSNVTEVEVTVEGGTVKLTNLQRIFQVQRENRSALDLV
jgi:hypothetical protein